MIKKTKKILNFFIIFFIIIISFEITSKLIIFIKFGHLKSSSDINRDNNINSFVQLIEEENKCPILVLYSSPIFRWVHWNNPECEQNIKYNSDGFVGPEFPISNSKDYYDILITGGSVSAQFGPGIKCNNKNNFCIDFLVKSLKIIVQEKNQ